MNNPMWSNNNFNNQVNMNNFNNNSFNNNNNQMNMNNTNNQNNMNINTNSVFNSNFQNNFNNNTINQTQQDSKGKMIFVTFTFLKNKKQIYIDVNENDSFENCLLILEDKYEWLKTIENKSYFIKDKKIENYKLSLKQLGIEESSDIIIKYN